MSNDRTPSNRDAWSWGRMGPFMISSLHYSKANSLVRLLIAFVMLSEGLIIAYLFIKITCIGHCAYFSVYLSCASLFTVHSLVHRDSCPCLHTNTFYSKFVLSKSKRKQGHFHACHSIRSEHSVEFALQGLCWSGVMFCQIDQSVAKARVS